MGFLSKSSKSEAGHSSALPTVGGMPLQAKLRYGQPGDSYEREADRVADSVVSNSKSGQTSAASPALAQGVSGAVQKSADEKNNSEINKEDPVQKKAAPNKEEKPVQKKATDKQDDNRMLQKKPADEKKEKPVQKKQADKDEKPVQKKAANKDEKPVQKKAANKDEKPVQKKEAPKKDEKPVQKKAAGEPEEKEGGQSNNRKAEDPGIEREIMAGKNGGNPMADDVRKEMEHQFGQDFTHVTIHNDGQSHELCRKINAQAFTHGSHIYFAEGKYDPQTTDGKHLLAHELTHIVQQNGKVQKMVQKAAGKATPKGAAKGAADPKAVITPDTYVSTINGTITKGAKSITIPQLRIPKFKEAPITPSSDLTIRPGRKQGEKRDTDQRKIWEDNAKTGSGLESALTTKLAKAAAFGNDSNPVKYMKIGNQKPDKSNFIVGNQTEIRNRLLRPYWKPTGDIQLYEVDHKREWQLNGDDVISNMWLLERTANGSSGRNIADEIQLKVGTLLSASADTVIWDNKVAPPFDDVKRDYAIKFQEVVPDLDLKSDSNPPDTYTLKQIQDGVQMAPVHPLSLKEVTDAGLTSDPTHLVIFNNAHGGKRYRLKIPSATAGEVKFDDKKFLPGFTPSTAALSPGQSTIALLKGVLWADNKLADAMYVEIPVSSMDGIPNTGVLNVGALERGIRKGEVHIKPFSPIKINTFDVDGAGDMLITGKINTGIPIIDGADIDFVIRGNTISIEKTFSGGEFKFPGPIKVPSSSITFSINSDHDIKAAGDAAVEINNVAKGKIHAEAHKSIGKGKGDDSGFSIAGHLEFDKKLFNGHASIDVAYDTKTGLGIGGELIMKPDDKSAFKTASIKVQYINNVLEASGEATFKLKSIKEVKLHILFTKDSAEIDGDIKLGSIPGIIKDGEGQFKLEKTGDQYDVGGSGTINPDIKGLSLAVNFTFHNDMFLVDVTIPKFEYGRLSGSLNIGITNQALGSDGKPTGKAGDDYRAFGESSLSLHITDDIIGKATLIFPENGEMEVKGDIILPEKFEVVPPILDINQKPIIEFPEIDIPLFAIPLGVTSIGLDAYIAPRLTGDAHLGPGYLTNIGVHVDYKPSEPDSLTIIGTADFDFRADASITAGVDFGVKIDAAIASVKGGIDISATAGIKAEQPVMKGAVKYNAATGFELDGDVKVIGDPFLSFKADLDITGSAGVWPLKVSHTWTHNLGEKNVDLGIPIGFSFHFGYANHKPDFPTFDKWDWKYPEFNRDLMKKIKAQLIDPVVDDIF
jgi:hypothetical protein